jgi:hypothetical protein
MADPHEATDVTHIDREPGCNCSQATLRRGEHDIACPKFVVTEARRFYQTLSMIGAIAAYLDVGEFKDRYAKAANAIDRFEVEVDLNGRLAVAIKQFSMSASPSEEDAAVPFEGWWPYEYEDEIEKIDGV